MRELCDFLGVPYYPAEVDKPLNQADPAPLSAEQRKRVYKKFEPIYQFVRGHFGGKLPHSWQQDMDSFS